MNETASHHTWIASNVCKDRANRILFIIKRSFGKGACYKWLQINSTWYDKRYNWHDQTTYPVRVRTHTWRYLPGRNPQWFWKPFSNTMSGQIGAEDFEIRLNLENTMTMMKNVINSQSFWMESILPAVITNSRFTNVQNLPPRVVAGFIFLSTMVFQGKQ